ncbi:MAG: hypothetical protein F4Y01_02255 [Gammaproteobacteria bacterium]|nr:hypothetical protein [Gammaproteobacteria bacterium]
MTSTSDTTERKQQQAASRGLLARAVGFLRRLFVSGRSVSGPRQPAEPAGTVDDLAGTAARPDAAAGALEDEPSPAPKARVPPTPKERPPGVGPKYAPLYHHLCDVEGDVWKTTFAEIRSILDNPLPRSALIYPAWWANTGKSQSNAWLKAGWSTQEVNLHSATLTFFRSGGLQKAAEEAAAGASDSQSSDATPTTAGSASTSPPSDGDEPRSEADRIRLFTFATVIAPARNANQQTVTVRAGDLHKEMGLQNRYASVVNALRGRKFAALADVTIVHQEGARVGASTQFTFALSDVAAGEEAAPVAAPPATEPAWEEPSARGSARGFPSTEEPSARENVPNTPATAEVPPAVAEVRTAEPPTVPAADAGTAAMAPRTRYSGPARTVVVIQGGEDKVASAGHMVLPDGRPVVFVAEPGVAPSDPGMAYRRPDDRADGIQTFRDALVAYNGTPEDNPLGLLPAWRLYEDDAYRTLAEGVEPENLFILSAGWGLIESDFLTPTYDITFSNGVATYKRRRPRDSYNDLRRLPSQGTSRLVFAGGTDYIPFFLELTEGITTERIVFHHASRAPLATAAQFVPVESDDTNDWHLQWARDYAAGKVALP